MKLERLTRLLAGYDQSAQKAQQETSSSEQQIAQVQAQSAEAVRVATDFGAGSTEFNPEVRRQRIDDLKEQVAKGTYRPDTRAVAEAVARDLLV